MSVKLQNPDSLSHFHGCEAKMPALNGFHSNGFKLDVDPVQLKIWFRLKDYFGCQSNEELLVKLLNIAQEYITSRTSSSEPASNQNEDFQTETNTYQLPAEPEVALKEASNKEQTQTTYESPTKPNPAKTSQFALKESNTDSKPVGPCRYCDMDHNHQECPINNPEHQVVDSIDCDSWNHYPSQEEEVFARVSLPSCLELSQSKNGGVISKISIKPFTKFGPLVGKSVREVDIPDDCDMRHIWEIQSELFEIARCL